MDTAEYTIHEGAGIEVYAEVSYTIQPGDGDGWNEPYEAPYVELGKVKLFKRKRRWVARRGVYNKYDAVWDITELGEAPSWVDDVIAADEDWQDDLLANALADDLDADARAYDARRDLQLTDR